MIVLNHSNFQKEVLESTIPVIVDFFGIWCPPCKILAPILEELDKEYKDKIKFTKVDIDENFELAEKYNIMSVPTLIFLKNGQERGRLVGLRPKEELKKEIEILIKP